MKRLLLTSLVSTALLIFPGSALIGQNIQNPYHSEATWQNWYNDSSSPGTDDKGLTIELPSENLRIYPVDPTEAEAEAGLYLKFSDTPNPLSSYAGFHRDLFLTYDNYHTSVGEAWLGEDGNVVSFRDASQGGQYRLMHFDDSVGNLGAIWTNQSTTGMGHDRTDRQFNALAVERDFYFKNVLRAGPAFTSTGGTIGDYYEVYLPSFFNTIGASFTVPPAYEKMIGAAAYMQEDLKRELLSNGLFMSTMLSVWKEALPYQVPAGHEARHRVAYRSTGLPQEYFPVLGGAPIFDQHGIGQTYPTYHNPRHMRNMVEMLKTMSVAPPISIFELESMTSGTLNYDMKTAIATRQSAGETVEMIVDVNESFDLQGYPISFRWELAYGNKQSTVEDLGAGRYRITVPPYDSSMPGGRTVLLLFANNGIYDSNPAAVNVYRDYGADDPTAEQPLMWPAAVEDLTVLPGESVNWDLFAYDLGGHPVTYYQWEGSDGVLDGSRFTYDAPADAEDHDQEVGLVATTALSGNDHGGKVARIKVRNTVARIGTDQVSGQAPLTVGFDASASADSAGNTLSVLWDFDDGSTSTALAPSHTFTDPGLYAVTLTVTGPLGSHTNTQLIEVAHSWPLTLQNGWTSSSIDPAVWNASGSTPTANNNRLGAYINFASAGDSSELESVATFNTGIYIEVDYTYELGRDRWIEVFGYGIGGVGRNSSANVSRATHFVGFGRFNENSESWSELEWLGTQREDPKSVHKLRLWVSDDPVNSGKIRFRGTITTDSEIIPIAIDNKDKLDSHLGLRGYGGGDGAQLRLYGFRAWQSSGSLAEPSVSMVDTDTGFSVYPTLDLASWDRHRVSERPLLPGRELGFTPVSGGQIEKTYEIVNRGNSPLTVSSIAFDPSWSAAPFSFLGPTSGTIPVGESMPVSIRFDPTSSGPSAIRLQVNSDDPIMPVYGVWIRGFGVNNSPEISVESEARFAISSGDMVPNAFDHTDFGSTAIGSSKERTFIVQNASWADLNISSISLTGSSDFTIQSAPSGILAPQSSRTVTVRYTPSALDGDTATLTISSNDSDEASFQFALAGEGVAAGTAQLVVSGNAQVISPGDSTPDTADFTDFGSTAAGPGGLQKRVFVLSNSGSADLAIDSAEIAGTGAAQFGLMRTAPQILQAGQSFDLPIAFYAESEGIFEATLTLHSNDPAQPSYNFALRGEVAGGLATYTITSATGHRPQNGEDAPHVDSGTATSGIYVNESTTLTFTVENTSPTETINSINASLTGADANVFSVTSAPAGSIAPGQQAIIELTFSPDENRNFDSTLRIDMSPVPGDPFEFTIRGVCQGDTIRFVSTSTFGLEDELGTVTATVERVGSGVGSASVDVAISENSDPFYGNPEVGVDFLFAPTTLYWGDGETGTRTFTLTILSDSDTEESELLYLLLENETGNADTQSADRNQPNPSYGVLIDNDDFTEAPGEDFSSSAANFDLSEKSLIWRPDGSGGYQGTVQTITEFPSDRTSGTVISGGGTTIGDDDDYRLDLPDGFEVPYFGVDYSTLFIGSNGSVTLGVSQTSFSNSLFSMFGSNGNLLVPRVALFWDDLNPEDGGTIRYFIDTTAGSERLVITYDAIQSYGSALVALTAQVEFWQNGTVVMSYLEMDSLDAPYSATVGISSGLVIPGYIARDLSAMPTGDITQASSFSDWKVFIDWGVHDDSASADPNANGIPNLLEYAFGFDDPISGSHSYQTVLSMVGGPEELSLTYRENRSAEDLIYTVRYSFDMLIWNDLTPGPEDISVSPLTPTVDEVTVTVPMSEDQMFLRLRVTENP